MFHTHVHLPVTLTSKQVTCIELHTCNIVLVTYNLLSQISFKWIKEKISPYTFVTMTQSHIIFLSEM